MVLSRHCPQLLFHQHPESRSPYDMYYNGGQTWRKASNLCMPNRTFSDSFHLHLKFILQDLGEFLLSDSSLALNQDCELCQFCWAAPFGATLTAALEREQLWPPWQLLPRAHPRVELDSGRVCKLARPVLRLHTHRINRSAEVPEVLPDISVRVNDCCIQRHICTSSAV